MGIIRKNDLKGAQWQWLPVEHCEYIYTKYPTTTSIPIKINSIKIY